VSNNADLRRFFGLVLLLLIPCFVVWMTISPWLASPAVWLCDLLLKAWLPDVVAAVQLSGSKALVMTNYGEMDGRIVSAAVAGYQNGYPVDVRLLSYSIPFYAALHFATPQSDSLSKFGWGLWILYPLVVLGVISVTLKNLMLGLGETFFTQEAVMLPNPHVIGILYQLSILIIPPLVPILLWGWQCRDNSLLQRLAPVKPVVEQAKES
jgi:hypothetical protein